MVYERKIINDPVFGFINIPKGLLYDIVRHPLLQRLTRIKQVGLSSVVYPGAQHTRFQHSLGAFYLMSEAITQLASKGNFIFDSEAEAVQAAILLHDIGHGPFSHVLEDTIVKGIPHEEISLMLMERMNKEMNGQLSLAIQIFKDEYPKRFLHQLVSGQLDMDRLDYLRRDSFYTGVTEGNIGSARIIKMLDVADDRLVVESKGIYSIENFLTARRLMYWQVYLHKTSVAYEKMLISTLLRAKELASQGIELFASPALRFFLYNDITPTEFYSNPDCLENFIQLDDNDIWTALKVWSTHTDKVLSTLSMGMINRNIFKVEISSEPISEDRKKELTLQISQQQRHLRAKLAGDIVNVIGRIFYHIVEQRADNTLIVHAQVKQDFRHRHRVHNIRLPGTAKLPFVGRAGQGIGLFNPGAVILGFLLNFRKERRKPIVIGLMVRRLFRGQLCRCRHRGYCFFILQGLHPLSVFAKWAWLPNPPCPQAVPGEFGFYHGESIPPGAGLLAPLTPVRRLPLFAGQNTAPRCQNPNRPGSLRTDIPQRKPADPGTPGIGGYRFAKRLCNRKAR